MDKICNSCGKNVDDSVNYCSYCHSQSFGNKNWIVKKDNSIAHLLFYEYYDGYYVISKAKVISIIVFLIFSLIVLVPPYSLDVIVFAAILGVFIYQLGKYIRNIIGDPSNAIIANNDYGLGIDLGHLLFFWQNKQGEYALSKTKIISHIVFILFFIMSFTTDVPSLFAAVVFGVIFEIPAFLIGYGIHKFTNPNPEASPKKAEAKKEAFTQKPEFQPKKEIIPEYSQYKKQLDDLNHKFKLKDEYVRNLIEKRFEPPQLTYTRFIGGVDKSEVMFNRNLKSALTMIELADEYSARIAGEIKSKITILDEINDKLDALSNELVLNENLSNKEDVDNLIGEMDDLINSVKSYSQK